MSKKDERRPDELAAYLDKHPDTQHIELLQPDMLGILRGKRVVRDEFAKPFQGGANFPARPSCSTRKVRRSTTSSMAVATAIQM